jgi:hypothetical protein
MMKIKIKIIKNEVFSILNKNQKINNNKDQDHIVQKNNHLIRIIINLINYLNHKLKEMDYY